MCMKCLHRSALTIHIANHDCDIMDIKEDAAQKTRVPYINEYGDFCFGRWTEREISWHNNNSIDWEAYSNGGTVAELDDYKR
jgi:hypothetical protein